MRAKIFSARCGAGARGYSSLHSGGAYQKRRSRSFAWPRCSRVRTAPHTPACPALAPIALRPGAVAQHAQLLAMRVNHRIIPTEQNSVEEPQRKLIGLSQQRRTKSQRPMTSQLTSLSEQHVKRHARHTIPPRPLGCLHSPCATLQAWPRGDSMPGGRSYARATATPGNSPAVGVSTRRRPIDNPRDSPHCRLRAHHLRVSSLGQRLSSPPCVQAAAVTTPTTARHGSGGFAIR